MVVKSGQHAGANLAAILGRGVIAVDLEPRAVVQFQQFGDQKAHRVAAEIGGEVADPQPVMGIACSRGQAFRCWRHFAGNPVGGAGGLQGRVVVHR